MISGSFWVILTHELVVHVSWQMQQVQLTPDFFKHDLTPLREHDLLMISVSSLGTWHLLRSLVRSSQVVSAGCVLKQRTWMRRAAR